MPRRHRSAREREVRPEAPGQPLNVAPEWAQADGFSVRTTAGGTGKEYRCPGCQQLIRPGTPHLVVLPEGDVGGRRHWHTPCWRRELKIRHPGR